MKRKLVLLMLGSLLISGCSNKGNMDTEVRVEDSGVVSEDTEKIEGIEGNAEVGDTAEEGSVDTEEEDDIERSEMDAVDDPSGLYFIHEDIPSDVIDIPMGTSEKVCGVLMPRLYPMEGRVSDSDGNESTARSLGFTTVEDFYNSEYIEDRVAPYIRVWDLDMGSSYEYQISDVNIDSIREKVSDGISIPDGYAYLDGEDTIYVFKDLGEGNTLLMRCFGSKVKDMGLDAVVGSLSSLVVMED